MPCEPAKDAADHCETLLKVRNARSRNSLHEIRSHKGCDSLELVDDRRWRNRRKKPAPVAFVRSRGSGTASTRDRGDDESAGRALLQSKDRERHLAFAERLAAARLTNGVDARSRDRIALATRTAACRQSRSSGRRRRVDALPKLDVARRTECGVSRNCFNSCVRGIVPWTKIG